MFKYRLTTLEGQWVSKEGPPIYILDINRSHEKFHLHLYFSDSEESDIVTHFNFSFHKDDIFKVHEIVYRKRRKDGDMVTESQLPGVDRDGLCEFRIINLNEIIEAEISQQDKNRTRLNFSKSSICTSQLSADEEITTWSKFRENFRSPNIYKWIFRGQSQRWPLQSAFHRYKKANINHYINELVPEEYSSLIHIIGDKFDLNKYNDQLAFLNFLQHHGYPTPLIDWTTSPFIAAWFAFKQRRSDEHDKFVRILAFNMFEWENHFHNENPIYSDRHISRVKPLQLINRRAFAQQSQFTFSNIVDIEGFIVEQEDRLKSKFLFAYDLPYEERGKALYEMRLMGISASSMFPGIDGICESLRGFHFYNIGDHSE